MIKSKNDGCNTFSFSATTYDYVLGKIENLDVAKASQQTDIPTKLLKLNSKYFAKFIVENLNFCIVNSEFPSAVKLADVIPIYKKTSKHSKDNDRPISILSMNVLKKDVILRVTAY